MNPNAGILLSSIRDQTAIISSILMSRSGILAILCSRTIIPLLEGTHHIYQLALVI